MDATVITLQKEKIPAYSWYALGLLTIIYVMNFLDRVLIYLLFTPIKSEMHFSDLQLALLGSTSFVIFYTLLGIPFGRLSDKVSRKKLIAFGLTVWSIFSGLTGFADSFWTIFACRMMVGIGEATLGPAALSMLSDYFPAEKRATVQAVFSSAIAIGAGIAFLFGGLINDAFGWRYAFYFLGFPGLVFVILILFLKEPQRGISDKKVIYESKDWKPLIRNLPFLLLILGYAFFAIASNSISIWLPTFFNRVQHLDLAQIGLWIGIGTIAGGLPGTILGGWLADKYKVKRAGGRLLFSSMIAFISVPFWLILLNTTSVVMQFILIMLLLGIGLAWLGPAAADVNDIAGPNLRGLAVGIYFFVVNAIGYGISPPLYGKLNDLLNVTQFPDVMRHTMLLSPAACLIAGIILYTASKILERRNNAN